MILIVVVVAVAVLIPLAVMVGYVYVYGRSHADMRFASDDVTVSDCRRDAVTGRPVVGVRVTSQAGRPGTYTVRLAFRDRRAGGGSVAAGERAVVVEDLAVGATAARQAGGPVPVRGLPECVVDDVSFVATGRAATP
ncbi:hypothetical protein [Streptomyces sp. NBC_01438]|uniref:hypothetical protein n=1 Tax=Streptomyces sp. NBC_01438 TaxID=2903866 RepID=UPI0032502015